MLRSLLGLKTLSFARIHPTILSPETPFPFSTLDGDEDGLQMNNGGWLDPTQKPSGAQKCGIQIEAA